MVARKCRGGRRRQVNSSATGTNTSETPQTPARSLRGSLLCSFQNRLQHIPQLIKAVWLADQTGLFKTSLQFTYHPHHHIPQLIRFVRFMHKPGMFITFDDIFYRLRAVTPYYVFSTSLTALVNVSKSIGFGRTLSADIALHILSS